MFSSVGSQGLNMFCASLLISQEKVRSSLLILVFLYVSTCLVSCHKKEGESYSSVFAALFTAESELFAVALVFHGYLNVNSTISCALLILHTCSKCTFLWSSWKPCFRSLTAAPPTTKLFPGTIQSASFNL